MRKIGPEHKAPWTVLVIPSHCGRVTNLRVPGWLVKVAVRATIATLAVSTYLLGSNLELRSKVKRYEELKVANRRQQREIMRLRREAQFIWDKMHAVEELDKQVRELVGLPPKEGELKRGAPEAGTPKEGRPREGSFEEGVLKDGNPKEGTGSRDEEVGSMGGGALPVDEWLEIPEKIAEDLDELNPLLERQAADLEKLKTDVLSRRRYLAALPDRWPLLGDIASGFGYRQSPFGGGREFHDGLDIAAGTGTPIVAAGSGRVVFAGWLLGYGRTVIIDHGYGYRSQYSHASSIVVGRGRTVKKGECIAGVGSTGRSTGPHLHFMISVNGKLVDPLEVLSKSQ